MQNSKLKALRKQLDNIDSNIISLLARRQEISTRIGELKQAHNLPVHDPLRENELLQSSTDLAKTLNLDPIFVRDIFDRILTESKTVQTKTKSKHLL